MTDHTAANPECARGTFPVRDEYREFLEAKSQLGGQHGFKPIWMPDFLFDFQRELVDWAVRKGRGALFCDCGLGKTPMQLVWAENVARHTNRPVLIATPLAVAYQVLREAEKFGVSVVRSSDGRIPAGAKIVVTNYERLEKFDPNELVGMVCDESSILKNFDGVRKAIVTEMMRKMPYRLLCTATAAPNDYIELGTSSEALGELGHMDMLARFFKNEQNTSKPVRRWTAQKTGWASLSAGGDRGVWRFKGHAERPFWRWVCSWARAVRRPSDLGYDDGRFVLPELTEQEHIVRTTKRRPGMLFELPAVGLHEEREEMRLTIEERCERAAAIATHDDQALVWCQLNAEGDLLEKMIPGAVQVAGSDSEDAKEERLVAFAEGKVRAMVTKPKIGAWGLNLQRCAHVTFFPSHSYEQYYQGVRRCYRFGQTRTVRVDLVATEGSKGALENLRRKAVAADRMFSALVEHMNDEMRIERKNEYLAEMENPFWL